ncbi:MAG: hypothetical protein QXL94_04350 [Candidatus Parvarchaeum sp.]
MINETFLDVKNQRKTLDSILLELSQKFTDKKGAFNPKNYHIIFSDGNFSGKYNRETDEIFIDKWFIYDMLCSGDIESIKNAVIHEEAHRQAELNSKCSDFADHWYGWLSEYLSMGGQPPQVYLKTKKYERSAEYKEVNSSDIKDIIMITDNGKNESKYLIERRKKINEPFILYQNTKHVIFLIK